MTDNLDLVPQKSLYRKKTHVKHESSITYHSKVIAIVQVYFGKKKKNDLDTCILTLTFTDDLAFGTKEEVLPQRIHM